MSNLENVNAVLINDQLSQSERLEKLNEIAISQMKVLSRTNEKYLMEYDNKEKKWNYESRNIYFRL